MYVQPSAALKVILEELIAVGNAFDGAEIALYSDDIYPNRTNVLADFTPITAGGLTAWTAVTFGSVAINANQAAEVVAALVSYLTSSTTGLPITAYGYVMRDGAGTAMLLAERFANPVTFNISGQFFGILPRLVVDC